MNVQVIKNCHSIFVHKFSYLSVFLLSKHFEGKKKFFFCSITFPTLKQGAPLEEAGADFIAEVLASLDNFPLSCPAVACRGLTALLRGVVSSQRTCKPSAGTCVPVGSYFVALWPLVDFFFVYLIPAYFFTAGWMLRTAMRFCSIRECFLTFNIYLCIISEGQHVL